MIWIAATPAHVLEVLSRSNDHALLGEIRAIAETLDLRHAVTTFQGDVAVGCMGVGWIMPKVLEAWAIYDVRFLERSGAKVARDAKRWLRRAETTLEPHRMQAHCEAGDAVGARWMRFLGFEFEGVMRKFSPLGEDRAMYARVY